MRKEERFGFWVFWGGGGLLTMAVIEFPLGPVTLTQAPHSAALSHTAPENAVPYRLLGMVDSVVKEQVPPLRLPP